MVGETLKTEELQDFSNENPTEIVIEEEKLQEDILDFEEVSVESETEPQTVEGYFYMKDTGEYVCKVGDSDVCYAVMEKKSNYLDIDVKNMGIKHNEFTETCNYIYHESVGTKNECLWIAHTINNAKLVKDVCGKDPTNNAVLWDGTDFFTKRKKQNKFKEYKKITISYEILKDYDAAVPFLHNDVFDDSIKNKKKLKKMEQVNGIL